MNHQARIERARREVVEARLRLGVSIAGLQLRLPRQLANRAWQGVRAKSGEVAEDALDAVKNRPAAAGGALAAVALVLARKPIGRLVSGWFAGKDEDEPQGLLEHRKK